MAFTSSALAFVKASQKQTLPGCLILMGLVFMGAMQLCNGERAREQLLSLGHCTDRRWIHTFYLPVKEAYLLAIALQPEEQASGLARD